MGHKLLFVDDEKNILNSLMRLFLDESYEIETALSAEEGLNMIIDKEISLVITDQMMPGMKGVDFLAEVKHISPETIRILLTGYADLEATIAAINRGEVYRFITKPWSDEELLLTVKQSLEYRDLVVRNRTLIETVKQHSYFVNRLEEVHPGITGVVKDKEGIVILDPTDMLKVSLEDLNITKKC